MALDIKPPKKTENSKKGFFSIFGGTPPSPEELKNKKEELDIRESELNKALKHLQKDQSKWLKEREKLQRNVEALEIKQKAMKGITGLEKVPAQLLKKEQQLGSLEHTLEDKELSLNTKEKSLRQRERDLEDVESKKIKAMKERDQALANLQKLREESILVKNFIKDNKKNLAAAGKARQMLNQLEEANALFNEKANEIDQKKKDLDAQIKSNNEIIRRRDKALKESEALILKVQALKTEKQETERIIKKQKDVSENLGKFINSKTKDILKKEENFEKEKQALDRLKEETKQNAAAIAEKESKLKRAYSEGESVIRKRVKVIEELESLKREENALKANIKNRKRVLDAVERDLTSQVSKFKKKEEEFMKSTEELSQKEEAANNRAREIEGMRALIDEREKSLLMREKDVMQKEKGKGLDTASIMKQKETLNIEIQKLNNEKLALNDEIVKRQDALKQFPKIGRVQEGLQKVKGSIDMKENDLIKREAALAEKYRMFAAKESMFRNDVRKSINLLKQKEKLENEVLSKKELVRQFPRMTKLQQDLKKLKEALDLKKDELDKKDKQLAQKERDLDIRGEETAERETKWLNAESQIKDMRESLMTDRTAFEDFLNMNRAELDTLKDEWANIAMELDTKRGDLLNLRSETDQMIKSDITALDERESEFVNKVKEIEDDHKKLRLQENAIIKTIKGLESARKRFEKLDEKERGLEAEKKELLKTEKKLEIEIKKTLNIRKIYENKEAKIANVKALKENLPALERRYAKLNNLAKGAEARLMGSTTEQLVKRERLMDMESEIRARETLIEKERTGLEEHEEDIMAREAELKLQERRWKKDATTAYADYLKSQLKDEPVAGASPKEEKYPQVYQMINDIRSKIEGGDLAGAKRQLSNLEATYSGSVRLEDKRLVNYDINELKTSIKLASLA